MPVYEVLEDGTVKKKAGSTASSGGELINEKAIDFAESERQKSKNLFGVSKTASTSYSGITLSCDDINKTYKLNGTGTGLSEASIGQTFLAGAKCKAGKTYTVSGRIVSGSHSGTTVGVGVYSSARGKYTQPILYFNFNNGAIVKSSSSTFTLTEDITYDSVRLWIASSGAVCNNLVFEIQLEENDTATSFQPYQGQIVHEAGTIPMPNLTTGTAQNFGGVAHIVESYISSDGLTWYRKWSDGWKECGGYTSSTTSPWLNITLPISFSNSSYSVQLTVEFYSPNTSAYWGVPLNLRSRDVQSINVYRYSNATGNIHYYCSGY